MADCKDEIHDECNPDWCPFEGYRFIEKLTKSFERHVVDEVSKIWRKDFYIWRHVEKEEVQKRTLWDTVKNGFFTMKMKIFGCPKPSSKPRRKQVNDGIDIYFEEFFNYDR
ncbi:unnamed protein product [Caenorhabditis brenneri]